MKHLIIVCKDAHRYIKYFELRIGVEENLSIKRAKIKYTFEHLSSGKVTHNSITCLMDTTDIDDTATSRNVSPPGSSQVLTSLGLILS